MERTLLVVSHRPLDLGGGGSVRWRHLRQALPAHGWQVVECSPPVGLTANESSTDPRAARLAARRAEVMAIAGRVLDPVARLLSVTPVTLAPNNMWAVTGRRVVRAAIEREQPDVILVTTPPVSALFATAASPFEAPLVVEFRDLWAGNPYYDRGSRLLASLESRAVKDASAVVTVTQGCRDGLERLHPELAQRLHVLPNGFDPVLLERRSPRRPHDGPARLVYAGALYGEHNAEALIEAIARPELRGRVRLELVGVVDPQTRRALGRTPALDVTVDPPVTWERAIERLLASDIAVAITTPSTGGDMALPNKMFEALAIGRPVLALATPGSDTAALLESLGRDSGLATPGDPNSIAAAIERLLAEPPPPVDPIALAPFDRDHVAARYADLLDEVATRSSFATSSGTTTSLR